MVLRCAMDDGWGVVKMCRDERKGRERLLIVCSGWRSMVLMGKQTHLIIIAYLDYSADFVIKRQPNSW